MATNNLLLDSLPVTDFYSSGLGLLNIDCACSSHLIDNFQVLNKKQQLLFFGNLWFFKYFLFLCELEVKRAWARARTPETKLRLALNKLQARTK